MIRRLSCFVLLPLAACNATAVELASQRDPSGGDPSDGAEWDIVELGEDMVIVPAEPTQDGTVTDDSDDGSEVDGPIDADDSVAADAAPYELEWIYQWGTAHADWVNDLALDEQGGVVVAVQSVSVEDDTEFRSHTLLRFDSSGALSWEASHEDSSDVSAAEYIAVAPNGDIYGVGVVEGESSDLRLTRFDALGEPQWSYVWGSDGRATPKALALDSAGNVLVAGDTEGILSGPTEGEGGAFVTLFDEAGEIVWQRRFGVDDEAVTAAAFSVDGGVVVGAVRHGAGALDSSIWGFDPSGEMTWSQDWLTPNVGSWAIALDEAGAILVGGALDDGTGVVQPLLAKLDSRGEVALFEAWDGDGQTWVHGVAPLADGGIALATTSHPGGSSASWSGIVIIDAGGNRMEPLRPKANRWTSFRHLEVDSSDALFVGGRTDSNLGGTYAVHGDAVVAKFRRVE